MPSIGRAFAKDAVPRCRLVLFAGHKLITFAVPHMLALEHNAFDHSATVNPDLQYKDGEDYDDDTENNATSFTCRSATLAILIYR